MSTPQEDSEVHTVKDLVWEGKAIVDSIGEQITRNSQYMAELQRTEKHLLANLDAIQQLITMHSEINKKLANS